MRLRLTAAALLAFGLGLTLGGALRLASDHRAPEPRVQHLPVRGEAA